MSTPDPANDLARVECAVCRDFLFDPTTLSCGHNFCLECVKLQTQCPLCRSPIGGMVPMARNHQLADIVQAAVGDDAWAGRVRETERASRYNDYLRSQRFMWITEVLDHIVSTHGIVGINDCVLAMTVMLRDQNMSPECRSHEALHAVAYCCESLYRVVHNVVFSADTDTRPHPIDRFLHWLRAHPNMHPPNCVIVQMVVAALPLPADVLDQFLVQLAPTVNIGRPPFKRAQVLQQTQDQIFLAHNQ